MTKLHALLLLVPTFCLAGCFGRFQNDRDAQWCVEDPRLMAAALSAGAEWADRSVDAESGPVNFSFYPPSAGHDCSDADTRIVSSSLPRHIAGSMGAFPGYAELKISPTITDPGQLHAVMLHELGHFLTGHEHSDDPEDIMYPDEVGVLHLTDADVARLDGVRRWPQ